MTDRKKEREIIRKKKNKKKPTHKDRLSTQLDYILIGWLIQGGLITNEHKNIKKLHREV